MAAGGIKHHNEPLFQRASIASDDFKLVALFYAALSLSFFG